MKDEWKGQKYGQLAETEPGELFLEGVKEKVNENKRCDGRGDDSVLWVTHYEFKGSPNEAYWNS